MNEKPIIIDLEIPNDADKIYEYVNYVLHAILEHTELHISNQRRIKLILVELLTNSIKHSDESTTQLQLIIDHPQLSIHKLEKGLQIEFSSAQQIPFDNIDKTLRISFSEANNHQIQPLDKYRFQFLNPVRADNLTLDHLPEHFGFYIITLASDSFIYQYDPKLKENRYIINMNI
jgi:hypothetical protein